MSKKQVKKELTKRQRTRKKAKESAKKFKNEIKKTVSTAIVAAFGFLIALVWKDVITEYVETITRISPVQGKLIQAIVITILGVIGILIVTKVFSEKS